MKASFFMGWTNVMEQILAWTLTWIWSVFVRTFLILSSSLSWSQRAVCTAKSRLKQQV